MGVDRTDYVMFGVDVGYDNVDYDLYEAEICGAPDADFRVVYDGMSSDYAIAGVVIAESDDYAGFGMITVDEEKLQPSNYAAEVRAILEQFPGVKREDFKILVFSHFS